jgi:hypothetical protein
VTLTADAIGFISFRPESRPTPVMEPSGFMTNSCTSRSTGNSLRVKTPLRALANKPLGDTIVPAGSTVEWQQGDYAGGMASVFWLRRRVLVMEADLFTQCERLTEVPDLRAKPTQSHQTIQHTRGVRKI